MEHSAIASQPRAIICPLCEAGELRLYGNALVRCDSCTGAVEGAVLKTLRQITSLTEALGRHACECGHPEMRRLPCGTFHCPSCGSEVFPVAAFSDPSGATGEAYRSGWADGLFEDSESFVHSRKLAGWEDAEDRRDYYRGHRAG